MILFKYKYIVHYTIIFFSIILYKNIYNFSMDIYLKNITHQFFNIYTLIYTTAYNYILQEIQLILLLYFLLFYYICMYYRNSWMRLLWNLRIGFWFVVHFQSQKYIILYLYVVSNYNFLSIFSLMLFLLIQLDNTYSIYKTLSKVKYGFLLYITYLHNIIHISHIKNKTNTIIKYIFTLFTYKTKSKLKSKNIYSNRLYNIK